MAIIGTGSFTTKGDVSMALVKVKTTGVYADEDGVHHFFKAGFEMPKGMTLVNAVDHLNERAEVGDDDSKAAPEPENKADAAPAKK